MNRKEVHREYIVFQKDIRKLKLLFHKANESGLSDTRVKLSCSYDSFLMTINSQWYYVLEAAEQEIQNNGQTYLLIKTWETQT